jgi:hypothetical protein
MAFQVNETGGYCTNLLDMYMHMFTVICFMGNTCVAFLSKGNREPTWH